MCTGPLGSEGNMLRMNAPIAGLWRIPGFTITVLLLSGLPAPVAAEDSTDLIGLSLEDAECSVRFGAGRFTSNDDIQHALSLLESAIRHLKQAVA